MTHRDETTMKTTKASLLRRMRAIDSGMDSASMMRGADAPECVRVWGIAQDAMSRADCAIAAGDWDAAREAMDAAREAMRDHAGMLRGMRGEEASR